jgi:hypothetical protein
MAVYASILYPGETTEDAEKVSMLALEMGV